MKSTERSPKPYKQQSKPNDQSPKLDLVAYKPAEKPKLRIQQEVRVKD
ncbi:hypothetical protein H6G93_18995 [Nostoc sp. FACHB-973]|nr:hypothetical protein [Nostoc sp. FACHB-973]